MPPPAQTTVQRSAFGTTRIAATLALAVAFGCSIVQRTPRETEVANRVDELVELISEPERASRAAEELAHLGIEAVPRLQYLLRTHSSPDRTLSYRQYTGICHTAGLMGGAAMALVPELTEAWTNGDRVVSQQAASVLLYLFPLLTDDAIAGLRAEASANPSPRWMQRLHRFEIDRELGACWFDDALRLALDRAAVGSASSLRLLLDSHPNDALHVYDARSQPLAVAALVARRRPAQNEESQALRNALAGLRTRALRVAPAHERDERLHTVAGALQRALHLLDDMNSMSPFVHDLDSAHAMLRDFEARERRAALAWFRRERPEVAPGLRLDVVRSLWDQDPAVVEDAIATLEFWPEAGAVALPALRSLSESGTGQSFRDRSTIAIHRVVAAQSARSPLAQRTLAAFHAILGGSLVALPPERDDAVVHDVLTGCRFANFATGEAVLQALGPPDEVDDKVFATVAETMMNAYGDCAISCTAFLAHDIARTERALRQHGIRLIELGQPDCCPWLGTLALELVARAPGALHSDRASRNPWLCTRAALHRAITRLRLCDALPSAMVWDEVAELLAVRRSNAWNLDRARDELAALAEIGRAPAVRKQVSSSTPLWPETYEARMRDLVLVRWADGSGAERLSELEALAQGALLPVPSVIAR